MTALDTNILIYACDKSDAARQQVALDLVSGAVDGVLLWQVACKFVAASEAERTGVHRVGCLEPSQGGVKALYSEDVPGLDALGPLKVLNPFIEWSLRR